MTNAFGGLVSQFAPRSILHPIKLYRGRVHDLSPCDYSRLKYEFCIKYSLSMGLGLTLPPPPPLLIAWNVSVVASSIWPKLLLPSRDISELQKLSFEWAGKSARSNGFQLEYFPTGI